MYDLVVLLIGEVYDFVEEVDVMMDGVCFVIWFIVFEEFEDFFM